MKGNCGLEDRQRDESREVAFQLQYAELTLACAKILSHFARVLFAFARAMGFLLGHICRLAGGTALCSNAPLRRRTVSW